MQECYHNDIDNEKKTIALEGAIFGPTFFMFLFFPFFLFFFLIKNLMTAPVVHA